MNCPATNALVATGFQFTKSAEDWMTKPWGAFPVTRKEKAPFGSRVGASRLNDTAPTFTGHAQSDDPMVH